MAAPFGRGPTIVSYDLSVVLPIGSRHRSCRANVLAEDSTGHRQLVASGRLNLRYRRPNQSSLQTATADFGPDLEFLGPGGSVLGGSDMIAAEMEEVVDLIVG
jgi:hypothetical protein